MTIIKTRAFQISDGNTYPTLELAQKAELFAALRLGRTEEETSALVTMLFENREVIGEILRASGRKPRKANGAKKRRTVLKPDKHGVVDLEKAGVSK